jgi:hypothetical protein
MKTKLVFRKCSSSGPNNFLLFPWSFSLTKWRREIYRLEELVMGLEFGVRKEKRE